MRIFVFSILCYFDFYVYYFLRAIDNVYIADYYNNRIRKVTISTGIITTIAGSGQTGGWGSFSGDNGAATSATLYYPYGLALDSSGTLIKVLYKFTIDHYILKIFILYRKYLYW